MKAAISRLLAAAVLLSALSSWSASGAKLDLWRNLHRGVNMTAHGSPEDYDAASKYGVHVVRVDDFAYLVDSEGEWDLSPANLRRVDDFIELCANKNLQVIFALSHVPGRRWAYRKNDTRIWSDAGYQESFFAAWRTLAQRLKTHANVVAYDLINEPYLPDEVNVDVRKLDYRALRERYQGTLRDVNLFYKKAVAAIRSVDQETPIIVETTGKGSIEAIDLLEPVADPTIIYSFHYYEPFNYFSRKLNRRRLTYPGNIPDMDTSESVFWNRSQHEKRLRPILDWQKRNGIESYRMFVGEFGVWKDARGVPRYLRDVIDVLNQDGWSWSYYAFRERDWDHCDLELAGRAKERGSTPLFRIVQRQFR